MNKNNEIVFFPFFYHVNFNMIKRVTETRPKGRNRAWKFCDSLTNFTDNSFFENLFT